MGDGISDAYRDERIEMEKLLKQVPLDSLEKELNRRKQFLKVHNLHTQYTELRKQYESEFGKLPHDPY